MTALWCVWSFKNPTVDTLCRNKAKTLYSTTLLLVCDLKHITACSPLLSPVHSSIYQSVWLLVPLPLSLTRLVDYRSKVRHLLKPPTSPGSPLLLPSLMGFWAWHGHPSRSIRFNLFFRTWSQRDLSKDPFLLSGLIGKSNFHCACLVLTCTCTCTCTCIMCI